MTEPIRAEDIAPRRIEWLWRERIPRGMLTLVGGRPDQGKGLFCAHLAAEISNTRYRDPDTGEARYGKVLYSASEDGHDTMTVPRLKAAGARLNKTVDVWRFQLPIMWEELSGYLLREKPDLLIMDPVAAHLSGGISRHSDNIRQVLNPLTDLIERTRTAVVMSEHVLKRVSPHAEPLAAIGGSGSGLPAAVRMGFLFGIDPSDGDRRVLACVKNNIREKPTAVTFEVDVAEVDVAGDQPYLMYEKEVEFDAMRLLISNRPGRVGRPPDKRAAAAEWVTNYLYAAPGPVQAGKVYEDAKQYAISSKTLRKAAQDVQVEINPPGGGRTCKWSLPDEIRGLMDDANAEVKAQEAEVPQTTLSDDDIEQLLGQGPKPAEEKDETDG